jgi:hypothetical protein
MKAQSHSMYLYCLLKVSDMFQHICHLQSLKYFRHMDKLTYIIGVYV